MRPQKALSSSVGSKFLIAFTGLSLFLFLVAHLGGNVLFLLGPDAFNQYSHKLIGNPLIYVAEGGLLCGSCGLVINGLPHGPDKGATTCQVHMRRFRDGETITVEPFRAKAFPVLKDLVIDRSAFDRIIAAGGYVSTNVGGAPDGNSSPIAKDVVDRAMDSAQCIGCGACVAVCKNAAAHLFTAAKITHLSLLPQGQAERQRRVIRMVDQMDREGFGSCSNEGECEAVCPKEISIANIARMHRDYLRAVVTG